MVKLFSEDKDGIRKTFKTECRIFVLVDEEDAPWQKKRKGKKEPGAFPQGGRLESLHRRQVEAEQLKAQTLHCALTKVDVAVMNYFNINWALLFLK